MRSKPRATHQNVSEAVVEAEDDSTGSKRLVAYVVARENVSSSELRNHLKQQLPGYMIPSAFVMLDALPLTTAGKIDRRALPAPSQLRPELGDEFIAPRTPTEEMLAAIWGSVACLQQVGINDTFLPRRPSRAGRRRLFADPRIVSGRPAVAQCVRVSSARRLATQLDIAIRASQELELPPLKPAPRDTDPPLSCAGNESGFSIIDPKCRLSRFCDPCAYEAYSTCRCWSEPLQRLSGDTRSIARLSQQVMVVRCNRFIPPSAVGWVRGLRHLPEAEREVPFSS